MPSRCGRGSRFISLALSFALLLTGCSDLPMSRLLPNRTSFGYVPERPGSVLEHPGDPQEAETFYNGIREWSYDVVDGYDRRATLNRYAVYAGAFVAAASLATVGALAAYDAGSSWLKGIPIGTGFLGSVLALYQSEPKARIYRLGARYAKDLIARSEERLTRRILIADQPQLALAAADKEATKAEAELKRRQEMKKTIDDRAADANQKAAGAVSAQREALVQVADAVMLEQQKAGRALERAQRNLDAAERRRAYVQEQLDRKDKGKSASLAELQIAEAFCLRDDIDSTMRNVGEHIARLDPQNVPERLQQVQGPAAHDEKPNLAGGAPTDDRADLLPPIVSACDNVLLP